MTVKIKKPIFEEAFRELEKIVAEFESQEVDLEKGLVHFERGMELAEFCKKHLEGVQNKVVEIKKRFGGVLGEGGNEKVG